MVETARGKLLDCSTRHLLGIIVRTEWRSSSMLGDDIGMALNGNGLGGDA